MPEPNAASSWSAHSTQDPGLRALSQSEGATVRRSVARRFSESPPSRAFTRKKRDIKSRVLTTIFIAAPSPAHNRYSRSRRTRAPLASTIYPITPMWAYVDFPASHHGTLSIHERDLSPPVHSAGIRRSHPSFHIACPSIRPISSLFHVPRGGQDKTGGGQDRSLAPHAYATATARKTPRHPRPSWAGSPG